MSVPFEWPSEWIGFHIVARTTGELPRAEIERACERALGLHVEAIDALPGTRLFDAAAASSAESGERSLTLRILKRPGWTEVALLPFTREHFTAHGASGVERLFESLCVTLDAHVARTVRPDGWAIVTPGELAGQIDGLDWLQYFGPRFSTWIARRPKRTDAPAIRSLPSGAAIVRLDVDPFDAAWRARVDAATALEITLRPLSEAAQKEVSSEQRLLDVLPPAPRRWTPAERAEMLAAREQVWRAIETGFAAGDLFERFQRLYLQAGAESLLLDVLETWLSYYGQDATVAALSSVARVHEKHTDAAPFDNEALEGCVKFIAWGGDDLTLAKRMQLLEHEIDLPDLAMPRFTREAWSRDIVAGMMKLSAALISSCACHRCATARADVP
jgi:hypothetical protein